MCWIETFFRRLAEMACDYTAEDAGVIEDWL